MTIGSRGREGLSSSITDAVFDVVRRTIPEGLNPEITPDTSLSEVGLDSLARMDVVNRLEEAFHVRFTEESLYDMETCSDLVEYIEATITGEAPARSRPNSTAPQRPASGEIRPERYDPELFPECVAFDQRLADTAAAGLDNPFFRVNQQANAETATIDGRDVVCFASFNYLGMSGNRKVAEAAKQAIDRFGTSAGASRLVGGDNTVLRELDAQIARFLGTEDAMVFPSGHGTNESVLGHLFSPDDLILYDDLAHNSIVQGALMSQAKRRPFPHNDFEFVDRLLSDTRNNHRRVVIAIEGVYSMDGDFPDLPNFIDVKRRHRALLYVDEAHSMAVMGDTGRGIGEHFGVDAGDVDVWMGTISKALGSGGGYIAGRNKLIQYLKYTAPAFVFATGPSPANTAAGLAALQVLQAEPERVARLRERSRLFLKLVKDCGLNTGHSGGTPIIPVILGNSALCVKISAALLAEGIDARPILYPAVPESASRVRFLVHADHTEEQIVRTVELLAKYVAEFRETAGAGV